MYLEMRRAAQGLPKPSWTGLRACKHKLASLLLLPYKCRVTAIELCMVRAASHHANGYLRVLNPDACHPPGWCESKGWHSFKSINQLMLIIFDVVMRLLALLRA